MGKRKSNVHGLQSRNYPISVAWKVDYDYLKKLSPEDKLWLSDFSDGYYGADFSGPNSSQWPQEQKRVGYTNKNVANADALPGLIHEKILKDLNSPVQSQFNNFTKLDKQKRLVQDCIPSVQTDNTPTPEYLNSQEYKDRLVAFRATLNPTRRECKPKETPEHIAARNKLNEVINQNVKHEE